MKAKLDYIWERGYAGRAKKMVDRNPHLIRTHRTVASAYAPGSLMLTWVTTIKDICGADATITWEADGTCIVNNIMVFLPPEVLDES